MSNRDLANAIIGKVGGMENIASTTNCMTRVRMNIKDMTKVDKDGLKAIPEVMGIVEQGTLQVVVGPGKALKVVEEMKSLGVNTTAGGSWQDNKSDISAKNQSPFKRGLKTISSIFIPLLPGVIAAGLLNGLGGLITNLQSTGTLPSNEILDLIRILFTTIGGAFFSAFAIFTGIFAARAFGASEVLGGMIGGVSIAAGVTEISQILGLYDQEVALNSILIAGKGGIIGVIFGVWVLSKVEKWFRTWVPDTLDLIITPLGSLLAVTIMMIFAIMPVAGFASDILVNILSFFIESDNNIMQLISGFILSAVFLPMVLLGLHHGLIPFYAVQLEATGGVTLFPILAMAGAGQVGAGIALYIKSRRRGLDEFSKVIAGALPAGVLGVGEPLIYGVTLPLGKPFITAGLGAGFGGAYVALSRVTASSWGPSGITAIPLMQPGSVLDFVIALFISYIAGFIITTLLFKDSDFDKIM